MSNSNHGMFDAIGHWRISVEPELKTWVKKLAKQVQKTGIRDTYEIIISYLNV